jgi:hypothetical protein
LVTAFRPPFVRIGRDAGTPAIGWSARLVLIVTTCPDLPRLHATDGELRHVEEPGHVGRYQRREVFGRVLAEWLGDEDARVVDEEVDASEPIGRLDDAGRHLGRRDVAVHEHEVRRWRQGAGIG